MSTPIRCLKAAATNRHLALISLAALSLLAALCACSDKAPSRPPSDVELSTETDAPELDTPTELGCDCSEGQVCCDGVCVWLQSDAAHCGGCGRFCGFGEQCVNGQCVCEPAPDTQARACDAHEQCCPGVGCVDLMSSALACGSCGRRCNPGEDCRAGECLCGAGLACSSGLACCEGRCCDQGERCCQGECAAPGSPLCVCGELAFCPLDTQCCGGSGDERCVDLHSDAEHCGACGQDCGVNAVCVGGSCQCLEGFLDCDPASPGCEASAADPQSCGRCGVVCVEGERCEAGNCWCGTLQGGCRVEGVGCCQDACVTLNRDPYCGACGVDCSSEAQDRVCLQGDGGLWSCACESDEDCGEGWVCDLGQCRACTPNWTETGGGEHCGRDWVLSDGAVIGGVHLGVGRFELPEGVSVRVDAVQNGTSGMFSVQAREISVQGVLDATASGHLGGNGGAGKGSGNPYCGGSGGSGANGAGLFGGTGGAGGSGHGGNDNDDPGCRSANGGSGGGGLPGGYASPGMNGDLSTDTQVWVGSGGGGGGGGGAGSRYGSNNNFPGGTGGGGGAGGRGGGAVSLQSTGLLSVSGSILANGTRTGGNGGNGQYYSPCNDRYYDPSGGSAGNASSHGSSAGGGGARQDVSCGSGGLSNTAGGNGGAGGAGAGGGILLEAEELELSGAVRALGGAQSNGGTVKLFCTCQRRSGVIEAGRILDQCQASCP